MSDHMRTGSTLHCGTLQYATGNVGWDAAMSAILPFMEDMQYRVRKRIVGNIAGVICFTVLYFLLPSSIYTYIGILGGIGVGLSAKYGWQAVFNTFGALAIATGVMD